MLLNIAKCSICLQSHRFEVHLTKKQEKQIELQGLRYDCPNIDRRYRLNRFYLNTTRNLFHDEHEWVREQASSIKESMRLELGVKDFEKKFKRWLNIDYPAIRMTDNDYSEKIEEIIITYAQGHFYAASTSAGALAERILNTLVIRLRPYYKDHPRYKDVRRKKSFSNWDTMIETLNDWDVLSVDAYNALKTLKKYRNNSIHYNDDYKFNLVASKIIKKLILVVKEVFGVQNRTDIFLVFDIPGEIWVRSDAEQKPFVKEFILPNCYYAHAVHDPDFDSGTFTEKLGKIGKLTDDEFVELRKQYANK